MNKRDILDYLAESTKPVTRREIARAFSVKKKGQEHLSHMLKDLENSGCIEKQSGAYTYLTGLHDVASVPDVSTLEVTEITLDGDVFARPVNWNEQTSGPAPSIEIMPDKKGHPSLTTGDHILARVEEGDDGQFEARVMRRLEAGKDRIVGIVAKNEKGYILQPTDKKSRYDYDLPDHALNGAKEGDIVAANILRPNHSALHKKATVMEVLGQKSDPRVFSLIAIEEAGLRHEFSDAVLKETMNMKVPDLGDREDLRDIPLVTIDGADARDFDDAVFCEETKTGFHLIVAIADVAHYVRPGSALDDEAYLRGNSTYFPDRVVPMLPEALSNGLCSLRPDEERACLAMHMWVSRHGKLEDYNVVRGLMKSKARLTYEQVQDARNGNPDDMTAPLLDKVITPLFKAYEALDKARTERHALDLDMPERQILVDEHNNMTGVTTRERLDSHKLIEEFMIMANVAAASALEQQKAPCVYRVHAQPDPLKVESIRDFIEAFGISMPKGQMSGPKQMNKLLEQASQLPHASIISQAVLRSLSQAHYSTENKGHFGLSLKRYAHFTSPIRRYSDLLVHRSLINAFNLGAGGLDEKQNATLEEMSEHISSTERLSMGAERSAVDRFTAAFLEDKIGQEFTGRITGLTKAGLFVQLDETGADGFLPRRMLPDDFYIHNEQQHALIGRKSGRVYRMGAEIDIKLIESDGMSGSTVFAPANKKSADLEGANFPPVKTRGGARGSKKGKKRGGPRR